MLVLKREKNQTIVVDGPCVITIGEIGSSSVKVLLAGPQTTKFLRGELVPIEQEQPGSASKDIALPPSQAG